MNNWLESPWAAQAKRAEPAAKKAKKASSQLQTKPTWPRKKVVAAHIADMVASRMHGGLALQNGGVDDRLALDERFQRIENNQGNLVELAVAEYITKNEDSVRIGMTKRSSPKLKKPTPSGTTGTS